MDNNAPDKPRLTVASSRTDEEIRHDYALNQFEWALREFMGNALRVMRGAGRPYQLIDGLMKLVDAINDMEGIRIAVANERFAEVLQSAMTMERGDMDVPNARHTIARGVLQMLASTLVMQNPQRLAGHSEIERGVEEMQEAWGRNRAQWAAADIIRKAEAEAKQIVDRAKREAKRLKAKPDPKTDPAPAVSEPERTTSTAEFMKRRMQEMTGRDTD